MNILLPNLLNLHIQYIPPYRASQIKQPLISQNDQIAFMTQFYPPPKLRKLALIEFQTNASSEPKSKIVIKEQKIRSREPKISLKNEQSSSEISQYEISQIKPQKRELATFSRKIKQKGLTQYEESQIQYQQLLDDLTFQKKYERLDLPSQNHQNQDFHFEFQEKDKSYLSDDKEKINHQKQHKKSKPKFLKDHLCQPSKRYFKWNSSGEILFMKQNKLKRIFMMFNNKVTSVYGELIDKIKNKEKVNEKKNNLKISIQKRNFQKCRSNKKIKQDNVIQKTQIPKLTL